MNYESREGVQRAPSCRIVVITIIIIAYKQAPAKYSARGAGACYDSRPESRIISLCSARSRIGSLRGASSQTTIIEHGNNDWKNG